MLEQMELDLILCFGTCFEKCNVRSNSFNWGPSFLSIGGSIITKLFLLAWFRKTLVTSVTTLDFPVVQAAVFVISVFVYLSITATDLAFIFIDPRLRGKERDNKYFQKLKF